MTLPFEKISPADQERILGILWAEFAERGYAGASTNTIVRKAGIPKGTLFYFFGSKNSMFFYALDEAVARFTAFMKEAGEDPPADLFEHLLHRMKNKLRFIRREPVLYRFFYKVFLEIPEELKEAMNARFAAYTAASQTLVIYSIDPAQLKEGIDPEAATTLIHLMLEGLLSRYSPLFKRLGAEENLDLISQIETECRAYFEMIRRGIYR